MNMRTSLKSTHVDERVPVPVQRIAVHGRGMRSTGKRKLWLVNSVLLYLRYAPSHISMTVSDTLYVLLSMTMCKSYHLMSNLEK